MIIENITRLSKYFGHEWAIYGYADHPIGRSALVHSSQAWRAWLEILQAGLIPDIEYYGDGVDSPWRDDRGEDYRLSPTSILSHCTATGRYTWESHGGREPGLWLQINRENAPGVIVVLIDSENDVDVIRSGNTGEFQFRHCQYMAELINIATGTDCWSGVDIVMALAGVGEPVPYRMARDEYAKYLRMEEPSCTT
jgi:hypothetical protein